WGESDPSRAPPPQKTNGNSRPLARHRPLPLRCIIKGVSGIGTGSGPNLPRSGRVEQCIRGPDRGAVPWPLLLVVPLERIEPNARRAPEPRRQPLNLARLLGRDEGVRYEGVLERVDAAMPDAAVLEAPGPGAPEGRVPDAAAVEVRKHDGIRLGT